MLADKSDDVLLSAESAGITDDALFPAESAGITDDVLLPAESAESASTTVGVRPIDRDSGRHGRGYPAGRPVPRSITRRDRTG